MKKKTLKVVWHGKSKTTQLVEEAQKEQALLKAQGRARRIWAAALIGLGVLLGLGLARAAHATTHTPTGYAVYPTRNDVATTTGDGRFFREENLGPMTKAALPQDFAYSGLTAPATSPNLAITVSGGVAYVNGFYVRITTNTSVDVAASTTNCIYLELTTTAGLVSAVRFNSNATCSAPSTYSFLLLSATANGSAITSATDMRVTRPYGLTGGFQSITIATTSGTWIAKAGRVWVEMVGAGGGGGGTINGSNNPTGGAGGAGGYRSEWFDVTITAAIPYQIGTGGPGGTTAGTSGTAGTSTWFLTSAHSAPGGSGGVGQTVNTATIAGCGAPGAAPAMASAYVYGKQGGYCQPDTRVATNNPYGNSGNGGDSFYGFGGVHGLSALSIAGTPGTYGGGGAGGYGYAGGSGQAGSAGGDGLLIIHY